MGSFALRASRVRRNFFSRRWRMCFSLDSKAALCALGKKIQELQLTGALGVGPAGQFADTAGRGSCARDSVSDMWRKRLGRHLGTAC